MIGRKIVTPLQLFSRSFSTSHRVKMPVTELVFPSYKQDPQSLAELKAKESQIFQPFSGVPGLENAFRGKILEEDGVSVDAASVRNVLVLEWDNPISFHNFFPKSAKFEEFVKAIKPFAAAPATPELYEAGTRSAACTSSTITQIVKVISNQTTEQVWKDLEDFVRNSSAESPNFYSANGIEKDKGVFLGLVGWKGWKDYERFGKEGSFLDHIKALNKDEKVQNIVAELSNIH